MATNRRGFLLSGAAPVVAASLGKEGRPDVGEPAPPVLAVRTKEPDDLPFVWTPIERVELRPGGMFLKLRPFIEWSRWHEEGEKEETEELTTISAECLFPSDRDFDDLFAFSAVALNAFLPPEPGTLSAVASDLLRERYQQGECCRALKARLYPVLALLGSVRVADFSAEHLEYYVVGQSDPRQELRSLDTIELLLAKGTGRSPSAFTGLIEQKKLEAQAYLKRREAENEQVRLWADRIASENPDVERALAAVDRYAEQNEFVRWKRFPIRWQIEEQAAGPGGAS